MREEAMRRLAAAGVESPRLEAQLLLALALGVSRTTVLTGLHPEPTAAQQARFESLLQARERRVPLAYLRGTQEFYGLTFAVSPAVLIPRPETELLVEFALEKGGDGILADVGTGSGCIAIAALAHCESAKGVALDISAEALTLAEQNARTNGVAERLRFARASLLSGAQADSFAVIVSNPPYIPTAEIPTLQTEVRDYEPRLALDGGADGLKFLRVLASDGMRTLYPGGWLAVEIALGQAEPVKAIFHSAGLVEIETRRDLAGIERVVCGKRSFPAL